MILYSSSSIVVKNHMLLQYLRTYYINQKLPYRVLYKRFIILIKRSVVFLKITLYILGYFYPNESHRRRASLYILEYPESEGGRLFINPKICGILLQTFLYTNTNLPNINYTQINFVYT